MTNPDLYSLSITTEPQRRSLFDALCWPTITHARREQFRWQAAISEHRTELRRLLSLQTGTHWLDLLIQTPGWQWRAARRECSTLRACRCALREAEDRVERMSAEMVPVFRKEAA